MPVHCERRGSKWVQVEDSSGRVVAESSTKAKCMISASIRNAAWRRKQQRAGG